MIKRIICLVFATVLVLSLFGCATNNDNKDGVNTDTESYVNTDMEVSEVTALSHGKLEQCIHHYSYDCCWRKGTDSYVWTGYETEVIVYFEKCTMFYCGRDHIILINGKEEHIKPRQYYTFEDVSQIEIPFFGNHYPCIELSSRLLGKKPITKEIYVGGGLYKKQLCCGGCKEEIENIKYKFCPHCGNKIFWGNNNEN